MKLNVFYQALLEFLQSLRFYAKSTKLSPKKIIEKSEQIINHLIALKKLRLELETLISHCGWTTFFPDLKETFEILGEDLKKIFVLMIAICREDHNPNINDSNDRVLLLKLQDLLNTLNKMKIFCNKTEAINKKLALQKKKFGSSKFQSFTKLIKEFYKLRTKHHKDCCLQLWNQFIHGMPMILDGKEGDEVIYRANPPSDIFWEHNGAQKNILFSKKFIFDDQYFTEIIEKINKQINNSQTDFKSELNRQRLIKMLYDDSCNEDIDQTFNCLINDKLQWQLDNFADEPMELVFTL